MNSEKEAEKLRERLAQEEAEAMEMEDEENKIENIHNEKEVCKELSGQLTFFTNVAIKYAVKM